MISEQDITVLGRKLFTFYSQKQGKVQLMKKAFDEGLWQESITFAADYNKQRKVLWSFYSGKHNKQDLSSWKAKDKLLKQGLNILSIVIWAIHNGMLDKKTSLYFVLPNPSPVGLADIQKLMETTIEFFPSSKISSISNKDLLSHEKRTRILIVLNFDSPRWLQEIKTISVIYLNSWGELFCESYDAKVGVEKILEYILEDPMNLKKNYTIFIPHSQYSKKIHDSLKSLIVKKVGR
jgi:adenylate cyclase class 1